MNHSQAQKNKPKTNPIKANPELTEALKKAEALSAVEGAAERAVEKFLSLYSESVTIIRKSVIRQFKRGRLRWRLFMNSVKESLEHSPVGSGLNLEISCHANAILFRKDGV